MSQALAHQSQAFETPCLDMAISYLTNVFRSHHLKFNTPSRDLAVHHQSIACGRTSFHMLTYGGNVRMSSEEMGNFFLFQLAINGPFRIVRNHRETEVPAGRSYAVNPEQTFEKDWSSNGRQLILRIERSVVEDYLKRLLGLAEAPSVEFHPVINDEAGLVMRSAHNHLANLCGHPARFQGQLEEMIVANVLSAFPNNFSDAIRAPVESCGPYYVRAAEDIIRSDPTADIAIADLAERAGVSVRALYYGFRNFRNTTPSEYVTNLRLDMAMRLLRDGDPNMTSVTSVATECGFGHLSNFSTRFQRRFNQKPSQVLRERRMPVRRI